MVDTYQALYVGFRAVRLQHRQVGEREPVVFVIIGQKSQCRILMLDPGIEYHPIPLEHLLEAAGPIDNMNELSGRTRSVMWHNHVLPQWNVGA
jgi:hypothetical protein